MKKILFKIVSTDGINRTLNLMKRPSKTNFLMLTFIYAGTRKHQRTGPETQFCQSELEASVELSIYRKAGAVLFVPRLAGCYLHLQRAYADKTIRNINQTAKE